MGIQGRDRRVENLDLAPRKLRLQLRLEKTRHAESRFGIPQGRGFTQDQHPQRSCFLLLTDLQRPGHSRQSLSDIRSTKSRIGPEHSLTRVQPKGGGPVMSQSPQRQFGTQQRQHRRQNGQSAEEPEPPGIRSGAGFHGS